MKLFSTAIGAVVAVTLVQSLPTSAELHRRSGEILTAKNAATVGAGASTAYLANKYLGKKGVTGYKKYGLTGAAAVAAMYGSRKVVDALNKKDSPPKSK